MPHVRAQEVRGSAGGLPSTNMARMHESRVGLIRVFVVEFVDGYATKYDKSSR